MPVGSRATSRSITTSPSGDDPHLFSLLAPPTAVKILYSTASKSSSAAAMEMAQQSHDVMVAVAGLVYVRLTQFFLGPCFAEGTLFLYLRYYTTQ